MKLILGKVIYLVAKFSVIIAVISLLVYSPKISAATHVTEESINLQLVTIENEIAQSSRDQLCESMLLDQALHNMSRTPTSSLHKCPTCESAITLIIDAVESEMIREHRLESSEQSMLAQNIIKMTHPREDFIFASAANINSEFALQMAEIDKELSLNSRAEFAGVEFLNQSLSQLNSGASFIRSPAAADVLPLNRFCPANASDICLMICNVEHRLNNTDRYTNAQQEMLTVALNSISESLEAANFGDNSLIQDNQNKPDPMLSHEGFQTGWQQIDTEISVSSGRPNSSTSGIQLQQAMP